jgi:hypothetical protein
MAIENTSKTEIKLKTAAVSLLPKVDNFEFACQTAISTKLLEIHSSIGNFAIENLPPVSDNRHRCWTSKITGRKSLVTLGINFSH